MSLEKLDLSESLHRYYMSCEGYFINLKSGSFEKLFLKYYRFLKGAGSDKGLILDVGCGVGQVVNKIGADGIEAVGTDVSPIGIRIAHKDRSNRSTATFVVASGYNLPFRENTFRKVGCLNVLEHLENPEACIKELIRVGDERIVVACPNLICPIYGRSFSEKLSKLKKLFLNMIGKGKRNEFEHVQPIMGETKETIGRDLDVATITSPWNLKTLLKANGIEIIHFSSYIGPSKIIDVISTLPFFRSIGGGVFLEGEIKK